MREANVSRHEKIKATIVDTETGVNLVLIDSEEVRRELPGDLDG